MVLEYIRLQAYRWSYVAITILIFGYNFGAARIAIHIHAGGSGTTHSHIRALIICLMINGKCCKSQSRIPMYSYYLEHLHRYHFPHVQRVVERQPLSHAWSTDTNADRQYDNAQLRVPIVHATMPLWPQDRSAQLHQNYNVSGHLKKQREGKQTTIRQCHQFIRDVLNGALISGSGSWHGDCESRMS